MRNSWFLLISLLAGCSASEAPQVAAPAAQVEDAPQPQPQANPKPAVDENRPLPVPEADTDTVILCTGATLKMGDIALWKKWIAQSERRFGGMYPEKSSSDLESYVLERALDKRRELERRGINSPRAFTQYYNSNCLGIIE